MVVLNGHFDGTGIVLDDPLPSTLRPQTRVQIVIPESEETSALAAEARKLIRDIADLAVPTDNLPSDYSAQHDHYLRGTPRK